VLTAEVTNTGSFCGDVTLSWSAASFRGQAVASYKLYRAIAPDAPSDLIYTGLALTFADSAGGLDEPTLITPGYRYMVRATCVSGATLDSNSVLAQHVTFAPEVPGGLVAKFVMTGAFNFYTHITWSPPAVNPDSAPVRYVLYREDGAYGSNDNWVEIIVDIDPVTNAAPPATHPHVVDIHNDEIRRYYMVAYAQWCGTSTWVSSAPSAIFEPPDLGGMPPPGPDNPYDWN